MEKYRKLPEGVTVREHINKRARKRRKIERAEFNAREYLYNISQNNLHGVIEALNFQTPDRDEEKPIARTPVLNDELFAQLKPVLDVVPGKIRLSEFLDLKGNATPEWNTAFSLLLRRQRTVYSNAMEYAVRVYDDLRGFVYKATTVEDFRKLHSSIHAFEPGKISGVQGTPRITPGVRFIAELFHMPPEGKVIRIHKKR